MGIGTSGCSYPILLRLLLIMVLSLAVVLLLAIATRVSFVLATETAFKYFGQSILLLWFPETVLN